MHTSEGLAFKTTLQMKQTLEYKSSHGGCPILLGSKWIFNKYNKQIKDALPSVHGRVKLQEKKSFAIYCQYCMLQTDTHMQPYI